MERERNGDREEKKNMRGLLFCFFLKVLLHNYHSSILYNYNIMNDVGTTVTN